MTQRTYGYDGYGNRTTASTSPIITSLRAWGTPSAATATTAGPRGQTSQRFYDAAGRLSETIDPLGNCTTCAYSSGGTQLGQESTQYNGVH